MPAARIIGPGRLGRSLAGALVAVGWRVAPLLGRGDDVEAAAEGVDVLVVATPDGAIGEVARRVRPQATTLVLHCSGALGADVLEPQPRRAALHPLVPLPDPVTGARRLRQGATFAVDGDAGAVTLVEALGGRSIAVPSGRRSLYHATASVAANHLVATLGQVERLAAAAGLDLDDFLPLARAALEDAARLGPAGALTGPVARGDWGTVARHLAALPAGEDAGYLGGVALTRRLAAG